MSFKKTKIEAISFFSKAIEQWNRLIGIYNELYRGSSWTDHSKKTKEGNDILMWFQDNYLHFRKYSTFNPINITPNGTELRLDPVYDVIFRGAHIDRIVEHSKYFENELHQGSAHLRGHLSSIKNMKEDISESQQQLPLILVRKILERFHQVANQLKRRRAGKTPFLVEDEYDVQDLLHALLKLDFDNITREDWAPSYAGGASRIDFVLKKSGILIEVKKTRKNLREAEIGKQLIVDIKKYAEYPGVNTLVCFVYDPENWIENPQGLEQDLEQLSTKKLDVEVHVQPRG